MRRWVVCAVTVALAVVAALGIGGVRSNRQEPAVGDWFGPGEVADVRGSELSLVDLREVPYEPQSSSDPVPDGAVVVQVDLQQRVVGTPEEENGRMCTLALVNGADSWSPDTDVRFDLDLSPNCDRTDDGPVEVGTERVITAAWVVPASALDGARVVVRFGAGDGVAVGFDPAG